MTLRVLVVEDSLTVRRHLCDVLARAENFTVIGEASSGDEAFRLCLALRPDVITLDMMLEGESGLVATERIMAWCPTPILIVSASVNRGEAFRTFDALAAGAVDVLEKPLGNEPAARWEADFAAAVRMVARIKVITHPRARLRPAPPVAPPPRAGVAREVVAIGASTGGPGAVRDILNSLPSDFPLPVLVVVHISSLFGARLAEWLASTSHLPVVLASDGQVLERAGHVYLAPPDRHLELRGGRLRLTEGPERHSCRPSVDVLFESVARDAGAGAIGCLLTGMGRDGAVGLLAMRRAGGATLAQDEETSVVYGMPAEASRLGAAESILPLGRISSAIVELARRSE